jgi:hypothetical protein
MTTTDTPSSTGIGISEAASRFEAFLSEPSETQTPKPTENAASHAAKTEEVEAQQADEAADETPPSDNEVEHDDAEAVEADDSADETTEDDEDGAADDDATAQAEPIELPDDAFEKLVTVKVNGKDEKITVKEALAGYSRTADYTRKAMALAEDKKAFEPEREAVRLEREQYAQLLPVLIEEIKQSLFAEPDWEALIASNPVEYVRQEKAWREKQDRLAAAQSEHARLNAEQEQQQQTVIAEAIRTGREELVKAMPQWKNADRWSADRERLLAYGQTIGYAPDDLKATYDPRAIVALYKAMRYDEIMAKRPKPQPSNGPKPAPAGNVAQKPRQASDLTRAKQRLAKTGRVRDAASLFEQFL